MASLSSENRELFKALYFKFVGLRYDGSEAHHYLLNSLLDQFNALDFKTLIVPDHTCGSQLIVSLSQQVPHNDSFLAAKASRLIVNIVTRQNISLFKDNVESCVEWFIMSLNNCSDIVLCDVLEGLGVVLKGNASLLTKYHNELIEPNGILTKILNSKSNCNEKKSLHSPFDITLYAIKCFESLVSINEDTVIKSNDEPWISSIHLEYCGNVFIKYMYKLKSNQQDELNYCQILLSCLSGCRYLVLHPTGWCYSKLGEILGAVKIHMHRGLKGFEELVPQKVLPSQQPMPEVSSNAGRVGCGGKVTPARKQRAFSNKKSVGASGDAESSNKGNYSTTLAETSFGANNTVSWNVTSESDFSDSESGLASKISKSHCRTRQKALELLLATIRAINRHEMFGYWHSLMPSSSCDKSQSLCNSVLHDPSPRCRVGALLALTAMLNGSRDYLSQADSSDKTLTAFTPFSVILGAILSALHSILGNAIVVENSLPVITQNLKCLSVLVQVTPYHRLESGLLTRLVSNIKGFAKHKDTTVQVAALVVLGCVVSIEPTIPEIYELISKPTPTQKLKRAYSKNTLEFLKINTQHTKSTDCSPARCQIKFPQAGCSKSEESFLNKNNIRLDEDYIDEDLDEVHLNNSKGFIEPGDQMSWLLEICLGNLGIGKDPAPAPIRIESLHVLSAIGSSFFSLLEGHLDSLSLAIGGALVDQYTESKLHAGRSLDSIGHAMNLYLLDEDKVKTTSGALCCAFWQSLLTPLTGLVQDTQNIPLRSIACDCLGNIGAEVFKHLSRDKQIFVVTVLFGCARDPEALVRAAAVRALAVCVVFPTLKEDFGFIMDTAEAVIRLMKEPNLQVRIKASWSLGNLSDAMVYAVNVQYEEVPSNMVMDLLKVSIDGAKDNDKVKCNAMRAVGNVLRIVKTELIAKPDWKPIIREAIMKLTNPTGTMKVRWNACYALGNVLRNSNLFLDADGKNWQQLIYSTLNDLVVKSPNFKVRINAAVSLAVPENRSQYGSHYMSVWTSLISALDHTSNMDDFSEYKHRDNLIDQICLSLAHLTSVCSPDDLCAIRNAIASSLDVIRLDVSRVAARLLPERAGKLLAAGSHVQAMLAESALTAEQTNAGNVISSVFM